MHASQDPRFRLNEEQARAIVSDFGTPVYVIDEAGFRSRVRAYRDAAAAAWPKSEVSYASKANPIAALMAIAYSEGVGIDVASEGELRAALRAGVPACACHLHGNNKSRGELRFALEVGVGKIMVDHFGEIQMVRDLLPEGSATEVVLRVAPGVDPITHAKISTGQSDTKFGFNIADGSALKAAELCLALGLPLVGFHCHVGSQLLDPEAQRGGGEELAKLATSLLTRFGFKTSYINVGGGLGIRYSDEDQPMPVQDYCRLVTNAVVGALESTGLDPVIAQEPGRSLVGECGVTLYSVGVVKTVPTASGPKTYVAVDGGLADNPRPALYGSHYTVERVGGGEDLGTVTVSGRHCETDRLFADIELPSDVEVGDLLQVLCTGAYNSAMSSNYNRYQRPPTVLVTTEGTFEVIQRKETWDELLERDLVPARLRQDS